MGQPWSPDELAQLLDRHGPALRLFAAQWTSEPDDCVQDAWMQLIRQPRRPDNVVAWLYRVVRNRAISLRRSARRRHEHEQNAGALGETWFEPNVTSKLDARRAAEALSELRVEQREIVVARIWSGLSFEEIADIVGTSRSGAHRTYHEALKVLRNKLGVPWPMHKVS